MKNVKLQLILIVMFVMLPCVVLFGGCSCDDDATASNVRYTVSFYTDSSLSFNYANQEVEHNGYARMPNVPFKENYFFVGWYSDPECTKLWLFESNRVTSNLKLYAKWELREDYENIEIDNDKTIKVYFYIGTDPLELYDTQIIDIGGTIQPPITPVRENYRFKGWYIDSNLEEKFDFGTTLNQETNLYAKWEEIKCVETTHNHIVNFYKGNVLSGAYYTIEITHGEIIDKLDNEPTIDGKIFVGWFTEKDGDIEWDLEKDIVTQDLQLFAKWEDE